VKLILPQFSPTFVLTMKRVIVIAFTGFYLALSLGFSPNLHYCGNNLAKIRIVVSAPNCCCDGLEDNNCCSDASISLQLDVDQELNYPPSWELQLPLAPICGIVFQEGSHNFLPQKIISHYPNPPPLIGFDARIKMRSLIYYG